MGGDGGVCGWSVACELAREWRSTTTSDELWPLRHRGATQFLPSSTESGRAQRALLVREGYDFAKTANISASTGKIMRLASMPRGPPVSHSAPVYRTSSKCPGSGRPWFPVLGA